MNEEQLESMKKRIMTLDPNQQLDLIRLLIDELRFNDINFDNHDYDLKESEKMRLFLEQTEQVLLNQIQFENTKRQVEGFSSLNISNKIEILSKLGGMISKKLIAQKHQENIDKCFNNGHIFEGELDGWKEKKLGVLENVHIDNQYITKTYWTRTCSICQKTESSVCEPEVVKRNRLETENQIKTLKLKINNLEKDKE